MILLVLDLTQIIVVSITGFFSLASLIVTILLKNKVAVVKETVVKVETKVDAVQAVQTDLVEKVNGHSTLLMKAVGDAKFAEGQQQQKDDAKTTAEDVVDAIKKDPSIDITKTKQ